MMGKSIPIPMAISVSLLKKRFYRDSSLTNQSPRHRASSRQSRLQSQNETEKLHWI